jgi:hypothetical protein
VAFAGGIGLILAASYAYIAVLGAGGELATALGCQEGLFVDELTTGLGTRSGCNTIGGAIGDPQLYVPLIGPWLHLNNPPPEAFQDHINTLVLVDGLVQDGAVVMEIIGLMRLGHLFDDNPAPLKPGIAWSVLPVAQGAVVGASLRLQLP